MGRSCLTIFFPFRFCHGLKTFSDLVKLNGNSFMWNRQLGYLASCPCNVGTGLRASVYVRLENLGRVGEKGRTNGVSVDRNYLLF